MAKQARVRRSWKKRTNRHLNRMVELFWRNVEKSRERTEMRAVSRAAKEIREEEDSRILEELTRVTDNGGF